MTRRHLAVFTTGFISREAFSLGERPENFYMIGSMGLAASLGLGLAMNTRKKVCVFDGDGSVLMEMGNLALMGFVRPKNFIHIVLDNQAYQSTGGQPTIAKKVSLDEIAKAAGYRSVFKITTLPELKKKIKSILNKQGPVFLLLKVNKQSSEEIGRVTYAPDYIHSRFSSAINI
jgi:thiamine pyrophosphate-dependent acetolactate synthase large subunit-like protein